MPSGGLRIRGKAATNDCSTWDTSQDIRTTVKPSGPWTDPGGLSQQHTDSSMAIG